MEQQFCVKRVREESSSPKRCKLCAPFSLLLMSQACKAQMNLRAMDAVFPVRGKSVKPYKILNESTPKEGDEFRHIDAVRAKRELRSKLNESSLQGTDEY